MRRISMRGASIGMAAAILAAFVVAGSAPAHQGGDPNYISSVNSVTPGASGLDVRVLDRDDRLEARAAGNRTVVVEGYNGEPYVRLSPGGRVEVNRRSPALYLNEDRYGEVDIPAIAEDENARPEWRRENGTGRFEWHDHRMHWMGKGRPEKVRDPGKRTRVFGWKVPIRVDGRPGAIAGRLEWVPTADSGPPAAAWYGLGALALAGAGAGVLMRRRRRRRPVEEAW